MSDSLHIDEGCTMSPQEALAAMRIAHEDEPRATAEEFVAELETLPAQIAGQPQGQKERCPACGSSNVTVWEQYSDLYRDIVGGKDCQDCRAMSRRWIGKGVGAKLWIPDQISETDFPDEGRGIVLAAIRPPMSNLGYANGWAETPLLVEKCKHPRDSRKIGRCLTEYSCSICNFKFTVDSGD